jgi:hypothetical protein
MVGLKLKIFQNYLFAKESTNSLTAYSKKLTFK